MAYEVGKDFEESIARLSEICIENDRIDQQLYSDYDVKRGLRDASGKGVLAGLTEISDIVAKKLDENGNDVPDYGRLYYRGYDVKDLVRGFSEYDGHCGFEETSYLLLFGKLPTASELKLFIQMLGEFRSLPNKFVRDFIMKAPCCDMMNSMQRSILTLYQYDANADDITISNVLRQCIQMIAQFPLLGCYAYQTYRHYYKDDNLVIRNPKKNLSTAENILRLLREEGEFTDTEVRVLDVCLALHAEHGGGNNSTFTTHVVSSSGTDTYSSMAASLGSLKGPRHGGANIRVTRMIADLKEQLGKKAYTDEAAVKDYLQKVLRGEAFDRSGLIYGIGHAVYSLSDPRCEILKDYARTLSAEQGFDQEFALYETIERLSPEVIAAERRIYKGVSANVAFYSGLVYQMLGIPEELFTPLFAIARVSGWSAHRLEELSNKGRIIRPAYKNVQSHLDYIPMKER